MSDVLNRLLSGGGTAYITQQGIEKARELPSMLGTAASGIAERVGEAAEFRPYTVTTGAGAAQFDPTGMSQTLGAQDQATVDALRQQAATQAGTIGSVTPEQLMSQMQSLRQPEQERQQLGLENRLAAQGRLGVQTAAYGGTPEQLAMQKAIQEQQSSDALNAISQARQLQGMDIQNVASMLGTAGIPQQQLTAAMQPALTGLNLAQRPADLEAQAIANLGQQQLAGIPSAINAEALMRQAQLEGLTNMLMGGQSATGSSASGGLNVGNLLSGVGGAIGSLFGGGSGNTQNSVNDAIKYISGFGSGTNALDVFGIGTPDVGSTSMFSTGAGTTPFDITSFLGDTGVYDPEADPYGLLGGGI